MRHIHANVGSQLGWGIVAWLVIFAAANLIPSAAAAEPQKLHYAPASLENPLKGLVPYAGDRNEAFPHTLEFSYISLGKLVIGPEQYDWTPLEALLNSIAGRGRQAVVRIYLEYPGQTKIIPQFLVDGGLKVHRYTNTNTQPLPPKEVETPDYEDPALRKCLQQFIAAFGKKYDGDARLGFITAGLLGTWGEWHTYPRAELFASKTVQTEVMDAYQASFRITPVLYRYPAGANDPAYAQNNNRPVGYHDDSFAWATLHTGKKNQDWYFVSKLKAAKAEDQWKTQPIGGEIRPEAWGKVFDETPGKNIQDFRACVDATHVTWLMDSGMFRKNVPEARRLRAEQEVRRMGYEFHVESVATRRANEAELQVQITLENHGVAPFYYDWPLEFVWLSQDKKLGEPTQVKGQLTKLLPGDEPRVVTTRVAATPRGKLLVRGVNMLANGRPIRFANRTQDQDQEGYLTLWEE